jgi:hypothetical protein
MNFVLHKLPEKYPSIYCYCSLLFPEFGLVFFYTMNLDLPWLLEL